MSAPEQALRDLGAGLAAAEHEALEMVGRLPPFEHRHPPVRNVNRQFEESFTTLERVALFITERVGSFGFFLIVATWSVLWLGWNTLGPRGLRFDPAPAFVLWLFISNLIQITIMPLIMVGQNLQSRHAELRAESDFEINQKAETEVEVILKYLERQSDQIERQQELLREVLRRLPAVEPERPAPRAEGE